MTRPAELAGVVLAGGGSVRMGTDKAQLRIDGERLVDRAVRLLGTVADPIVVVAGPRRRLQPAGVVTEVPDAGVGPLGGIAAGLEAVAAPAVAVLAVDQPDPCPALLVELARRRGLAPCAAPVVGGRLQPLHAVWARDVRSRLRTALDTGQRSPSAWLEGAGVRRIGPEVWRRYDAAGTFAVSWDRPGDVDGRVDP